MSIGGVRYKIKSHRRDAESAEKERNIFAHSAPLR